MSRRLGERIGAALLLVACATAPVGRELTEKTFDFQSYSVAAPEGGGWGLAEFDRAQRKVAFERATVAVLAGYVSASTYITVFEVPIAPGGWTLTEEQHANGYRDNELHVMNEEGVHKGQYELRNVRKAVEAVAGLKLYSLRYETVVGNWFTGGKESASVLYLYFPPDLAERHAFYGFLITAATVKGSIYSTSPDLKLIDPVIASFRLGPRSPSPLFATQVPCVKWSSTCTVRCTDGTTHSITVAPCLDETPTESVCAYASAGDHALACPGPNASFQDCGDCTPWKTEP